MRQGTVEPASDATLRRIAAMVRDERERAQRRFAPFAYREWLDELLALAERDPEMPRSD